MGDLSHRSSYFRCLFSFEVRPHRKAQHGSGEIFGKGQPAGFAIAAGISTGEVRRHRIVNKRADTGLGKSLPQEIATGMPDIFAFFNAHSKAGK